MLDGVLHHGAAGRLGESGHIQVPTFGVDPPAWPRIQDVIGLPKLHQRYLGKGGRASTFEGMIDDLANGVRPARSAANEWEDQVAWFTSVLVWTLAPQLVVFGGRASAVIGLRGLESIRSRLDLALEIPDFAVSVFGADGIVMGAAALPMSEFFALPVLRPEQAISWGKAVAPAG